MNSTTMEIDKNTRLEIENLSLRIPSLDDIPHIFSSTRFEGFNDGMAWEAPASQEELIAPYHRNIKAWEEGRGYSFTIEEKQTKQFLGRISIRKTETENRWNVGFWTHPNHQGQGIMTKALSAILKFGFETLQAEVIEAYHAIWNKGSEKVLMNNGMKFIKYVEQGFKKNGVWVEENLLAIGKEEWVKLQDSY